MSVSVASRVFFPDPDEHTATVLVVEDEILIRIAIAAYLQECGFKVLEAGNAAEAMQILTTDFMPVDLVFTDVKMPGGMDGFALAEWVRANRPDTPVMLTSGDEMKCQTARNLCANDCFFAKPYDVGAVAAEIGRLVGAPGEE
jgi:CheY-like chemotaxis protein